MKTKMKFGCKEMRKNLSWKGKKRMFKKAYSHRYIYKILDMMELKVGDLVNKCDGYNGVIKKINKEIGYYSSRKTYKQFYPVFCDLDLIFEDGACCSYIHCCSPKESKEEIEQKAKDCIEYYKENGPNEWELYDKESILMAKGLPICDEMGLKIQYPDDMFKVQQEDQNVKD